VLPVSPVMQLEPSAVEFGKELLPQLRLLPTSILSPTSLLSCSDSPTVSSSSRSRSSDTSTDVSLGEELSDSLSQSDRPERSHVGFTGTAWTTCVGLGDSAIRRIGDSSKLRDLDVSNESDTSKLPRARAIGDFSPGLHGVIDNESDARREPSASPRLSDSNVIKDRAFWAESADSTLKEAVRSARRILIAGDTDTCLWGEIPLACVASVVVKYAIGRFLVSLMSALSALKYAIGSSVVGGDCLWGEIPLMSLMSALSSLKYAIGSSVVLGDSGGLAGGGIFALQAFAPLLLLLGAPDLGMAFRGCAPTRTAFRTASWYNSRSPKRIASCKSASTVRAVNATGEASHAGETSGMGFGTSCTCTCSAGSASVTERNRLRLPLTFSIVGSREGKKSTDRLAIEVSEVALEVELLMVALEGDTDSAAGGSGSGRPSHGPDSAAPELTAAELEETVLTAAELATAVSPAASQGAGDQTFEGDVTDDVRAVAFEGDGGHTMAALKVEPGGAGELGRSVVCKGLWLCVT